MMLATAQPIPYSARGVRGLGDLTSEQTAAMTDADALFTEAQDLTTFALFGAASKTRAQQIATEADRLQGEVTNGRMTPNAAGNALRVLRVQLDDLQRARRINIALVSLAGVSVLAVGGYYANRARKKRKA